MRAWKRPLFASLRLMIAATLVLGIAYPAFGLALGAAMPGRAHGSLIEVNGTVVGSGLIGQQVTGDQWFHARPSASDGDGMASGPTNLGPSNPELLDAIASRKAEVAQREGVAQSAVPADAVTASASGLDPDISVAYARLQAPRVARERGLAVDAVLALVDRFTTHAPLGVLGADAVNVVRLNAALAAGQ